jgi:ribosome biogenesis GTPase
LSLSVSPFLTRLGWDDGHQADFDALAIPDAVPARVVRPELGAGQVLADSGEMLVGWGRRLDATPTVGDWVVVTPPTDGGRPEAVAVLPRRSSFVRKVAGKATSDQVVAANVDTVFIACPLNEPVNLRRLERYLTVAWESGAVPVVLLTKSDLCDDLEGEMREVGQVAIGVDAIAVSVPVERGLDEIRSYLDGNRTVALVGSSGVGKSTLVNALCGEELLEVRDIRADGKGRHTTTHRQLVLVPTGGLIIDTPGMRELGMFDVSDGIARTFADVEELVSACRFNDCSHRTEPGCAIKAALADGSLDPERYESWCRLHRELAHVTRRIDHQAAKEELRIWKQRTMANRQRPPKR